MSDTVEERQINAWVELTAQVCHEANRAVQVVNGDLDVSPNWADAPVSQKASAIKGVENALAGQTPKELHDSWAKYKRDTGWVYGPVKSEFYRTHPCLVPYEALPREQQMKDHVFQAIVRAFKDAKVLG